MVDTPETRASLAAILAADAGLAEWTVHPEPPENLARGLNLVVSPRDPYQAYSTYGHVETMVSATLLVPRAHGPAMDVIDPALIALRAALGSLRGATIGDTRTGIIDEVGGLEFVAAMVDITLS